MKTPKTCRPRRRGLAAVPALFALILASTGCYGPHTVAYVDSTRAPSERELSHGLDGRRVQYERCGEAGVARIETYSGWFDMLLSYMTFSDADRSVDIVCAREEGP